MLEIDLRSFQRAARDAGEAVDQVPYALSLALNEAVKVTRGHEVNDVWPAHVQVRNRSFIGAALRMEFASKRNLQVSIYDRLGRAHLKKHDKGGVKQAKGRLAIPDRKVRRTGKGVTAKQRPAALPNSFRKGDAIYQRVGPRGRRLQLMYVLKPSATIKADVPFAAEFATTMRREINARFGPAMVRAMKGRR